MGSQNGVFRYFLPGLEPLSVTPAEIASRGLSDRLGDLITGQAADTLGGVQISKVVGGPGGVPGVLIVPMPADGSNVDRPDYHADGQTWVESSRGAYWIGSDDANPPTPAGAQRDEVVDGYEHALGDGNVWVCPTIRRAMIVPAVPCSYSRMNGELTRKPLAKYADIFTRTLRFASQYASGESVDKLDQWELAVQCLCVNYRVADEEVSLLELLNDRTLELVMEAAFDLPWLKSAMDGSDPQKKRAWDSIVAAMGSSEPGAPDSSAATSQPQPTSC